MSNKKSAELKEYCRACNKLAEEFSRKYCDSAGVCWVGGKIGDVADIGDVFMSITQIADVMELNPSPEQFYDAYWYNIESKGKINLYNLIKYGKVSDKKIKE